MKLVTSTSSVVTAISHLHSR